MDPDSTLGLSLLIALVAIIALAAWGWNRDPAWGFGKAPSKARPEPPSKYLRPIRRGEYDLVNISLVGFDPTTGQTYEECHDAWSAEREKLVAEEKTLRWWQIVRHIRWRFKVAALASHFGMW